MIYENISSSTLKDFHNSIKECLNKDDATPNGHMKPYGVREYSDWSDHLEKIEAALTKRQEPFTPIVLASDSNASRPIPIEAVLYERIKQCLASEDDLPSGAEKPYGVRENTDWLNQVKSLENALDKLGYSYSKIVL